MITIVDYGIGNLGSISNMFKKIGHQSKITADHSIIATAEKLVIPGVGAFDAGMSSLKNSGLVDLLTQRVVSDQVPTLGICLGMQLMTMTSEEGSMKGLGWVDADVVRFRPNRSTVKVPHMGWNVVQPVCSDPLLQDLPDPSRFYFVHSYHVRCKKAAEVLLTAHYEVEFHAAFRRNNIWGVQFHPEKSHKFGMRLLANFAERC